jgi:hypothetical protein
VLLAACSGSVSATDTQMESSSSDEDDPWGWEGRDAGARDAQPADAHDEKPSTARDASASDGGREDARVANAPDKPVASGKTLHVEGNKLVDTCGKPWVARGIEQLAAKPFAHDSTIAGLAAELVKTGSNAVRLLPQQLGPADMETLLEALSAAKIVVYLSPGDRDWFKRRDIREVLMRYEKGLIIDAFQEPDYDDVARWRNDVKGAIEELRSAGYSAPLTVLANQYGRDLKSALQHGEEVLSADPQKNTILGWQAYWGKSGWYQRSSGMTLTEGVAACAKQKYPMQVGIDLYADANDLMDYQEVMAAAQQHGIGWLWWNFWNQYDNLGNNASIDGTAARLTQAGQVVLKSDPHSIEKTAKKACFE